MVAMVTQCKYYGGLSYDRLPGMVSLRYALRQAIINGYHGNHCCCSLCKVSAEAEETVEHRAYNTT